MKVRTLKPHGNCHGNTFEKHPGDEYEHPAPKAELTLRNVERVDEDDDQAARPEGRRAKVGAGKGRNGKEQNAKSPARSRRAGRKKDAVART